MITGNSSVRPYCSYRHLPRRRDNSYPRCIEAVLTEGSLQPPSNWIRQAGGGFRGRGSVYARTSSWRAPFAVSRPNTYIEVRGWLFTEPACPVFVSAGGKGCPVGWPAFETPSKTMGGTEMSSAFPWRIPAFLGIPLVLLGRGSVFFGDPSSFLGEAPSLLGEGSSFLGDPSPFWTRVRLSWETPRLFWERGRLFWAASALFGRASVLLGRPSSRIPEPLDTDPSLTRPPPFATLPLPWQTPRG